MVVGTLRLALLLGENFSLKGKRQVLKSLKERVKNRFNVSIAEVENQDLWQHIVLGLAVVGNDRRHVNAQLDKILEFVEKQNLAEIMDSQLELINL
jgi:uncharacterized protein YlxP (DUF503 family)